MFAIGRSRIVDHAADRVHDFMHGEHGEGMPRHLE